MIRHYYVYDHTKKMVVDMLPMPYYKATIIPAYDVIYGSNRESRFTLFVYKSTIPK